MASLAKQLILCSSSPSQRRRRPLPINAAAGSDKQPATPQSATRRLAVAASAALAATAALAARRPAAPPPALAAEAAAVPVAPTPPGSVPRWGTRSYVRERFFEPKLTADEAAARIRQTAEGMRTLRPMLETMSWKYVLFYVRLKSKYLDLDLTTAMAGVPEGRRPDYVRVANELVDNMTEVRAFANLNVFIRYYLTVRFPIAGDAISDLNLLSTVPHSSRSSCEPPRSTSPTSTTRIPSSHWMMWQSSLLDVHTVQVVLFPRSKNINIFTFAQRTIQRH
jgi:photosystem II oxygen-evolving enhancer protein 3